MSNTNGGWDFSGFTSPPSNATSNSGFGQQGQSGQQGQGQANPFGANQYGANQYGQSGQGFGQSGQGAGTGASPFGTGGQAGPAGGPQPDLFGSGSSRDLFGTANSMSAAPSRLEAVSAPTGWLFAAVGLALVAGIAASIFGGIPAVAIACWAVAGPVVIGLLAVYLMNDVKARAHLTYSPPTWGPLLYGVTLVITFIAVMIASLQIAFWVGRM